jgi:hypothetical protein
VWLGQPEILRFRLSFPVGHSIAFEATITGRVSASVSTCNVFAEIL